MIDKILIFITHGRLWTVKCLVLCLTAALLLSCTPAIWMFPEIELPPAYQLKSESPLADTAMLTVPKHEGERSHGAKLTPRLLSSTLLCAATSLGRHPYLPATLGGLLYLLCGVVVGQKLTGNRSDGFATGLLLAGLYATNACFSMNHGPKPFDGIAIGMVALTLTMVDRTWLLAVSAYLACWTDERAVLSLAFIAALVIVRESYDAAAKQNRCIALGAAVMLYALTRLLAARWLQWTSTDTSMLGDNLIAALSYSQMAAWTCFEGGWIVIGSAIWFAVQRGCVKDAIVLAAVVAVAIGSCLLVLDISRAAAFGFPVLFVAIAVLQKHAGNARRVVGRTIGLAAIGSLVSGNVEIISSIAYTPLPATPVVVLLRWMT